MRWEEMIWTWRFMTKGVRMIPDDECRFDEERGFFCDKKLWAWSSDDGDWCHLAP